MDEHEHDREQRQPAPPPATNRSGNVTVAPTATAPRSE